MKLHCLRNRSARSFSFLSKTLLPYLRESEATESLGRDSCCIRRTICRAEFWAMSFIPACDVSALRAPVFFFQISSAIWTTLQGEAKQLVSLILFVAALLPIGSAWWWVTVWRRVIAKPDEGCFLACAQIISVFWNLLLGIACAVEFGPGRAHALRPRCLHVVARFVVCLT